MPKVSVILTSYNHEKYIREAIDSVLGQTLTDFELIIWDDASNDASWNIINGYTDPRVRAFRNEERRRAAYGLNKAISEMALGEYIAVHHSDDIWERDKLAKQVTFLDEHPECGAVFTNITAIGEDSKTIKNKRNFYNRKFEQPNRTRFEWLHFFFHRGNALCHPIIWPPNLQPTDQGRYFRHPQSRADLGKPDHLRYRSSGAEGFTSPEKEVRGCG